MRRLTPRLAAAAVLTPRLAAAAVTIACVVPAAAHGQASVPEPAGPDFKALLLADPAVSTAIKGAVRDGTAFVRPAAFADLTADGRADALLLVGVPGAAGTVAAYVLSAPTAQGRALRLVFGSQALYRASVRVVAGALKVVTPEYARGDDVCCPSALRQRTYRYDPRSRRLARTDSRRFPRGPG